MNDPAEPESLARLERRLGRVLATGVASSALALATGLGWYMLSPDDAGVSRLFAVGLVVLMATPILRVIVSLIEYVRMREWAFVVITIAVFVELTIGALYSFRRQ
jgi:uncharacterized membrane protein